MNKSKKIGRNLENMKKLENIKNFIKWKNIWKNIWKNKENL